MARIKFPKRKQREFIDSVVRNSNSPSLRALLQFGISASYSSLKKYHSELRCLPENLFNELCVVGNFDKASLKFEILDECWGQIKGGKSKKI